MDSTLHFDRFTLQPGRRLLLEDGAPVRLGSRALDLLVALTARPGEVISRQELEADVWPRSVVEETSLRVHTSRLRKALRDGQGGARYIVNVPGRGYAFVAEISVEPPCLPTSTPARPTSDIGVRQELRELLTAASTVSGGTADPRATSLLFLLRDWHAGAVHAS